MTNDYWIALVVAALATYRLSRMLAIEEGPFEIFLNLRGFFWHKFPHQWVQKGITCPYCISFYVGLLAAVLVSLTVHLEWYGILWLWFALSGAACFLYSMEK